MNDGSSKLVTLGDLFSHGRQLLVPDKPCSPYRYIEFLIERTLQQKFELKKVIELGPGSDSGLLYLDLGALESAWLIDYSQGALDAVRSKITTNKINYRMANITSSEAIGDLYGKFDYLICNSVIEHIRGDIPLVQTMRDLLEPGGILVCSTVLHQRMYNIWDYAVGHYRRYSFRDLVDMFSDFSEVQVLQTSIVQELLRPLFFSRVRHLTKNTLEENNLLTAVGHQEWGRVPYAGVWPVIKYAMPLYLVTEWALQHVVGGIAFVIGRK